MTISRFTGTQNGGLLLILLWSCTLRTTYYTPHLALGTGNTYRYTLTEKSHTLSTQKGEKVATDNQVSMDLLCNTKANAQDITYDGFALHQQSEESQVDVDDASALLSPDPSTRMFGAFHEATVECTFDRRGRVTHLTGMDSIYRKMAILGKEEGENNNRYAQVWQHQCSPDYFSRLFEKGFCPFPDAPVSVGDTWTGTDSLDADPRIPLATYYTLLKVQAGILFIQAESVVDIQDRSLDTTGRSGQLTLQGRQHGTLQVDAASGVVLSGQTVLDAKGTLQMGAVSLPLIIDSTCTVTASHA